jgi:hypothetical protein
MQKDLNRLLESPQLRAVEFDIEQLFARRGGSPETFDIYDVLVELLYFWRYDLLDKRFKIEGKKECSRFEIFSYKERANRFLEKHTEGMARPLQIYFAAVFNGLRTIKRIKERVEFADRIRLFSKEEDFEDDNNPFEIKVEYEKIDLNN